MADWGMVAIRFALYADLMLLVGLAAFPLYSLTRSEQHDRTVLPLNATLTWLTLAGLALSSIAFALSSAAMMGVSIWALDRPMMLSMATETDQGAAWIVRMAALALTLGTSVALTANQTRKYAVTLTGGAVALATLVWSGHAAASEGLFGAAHRAIDIAHMIAAALWIGGLAAFALLLRARAKDLDAANVTLVARTLTCFAPVGTVAVVIIALTGLFNSYAIFGANVLALVKTTYGFLLIGKVVLVCLMLFLAANNRWRLTPALERATGNDCAEAAWVGLRRSVAVEAAAGATVLFLVAWLGMIDPVSG